MIQAKTKPRTSDSKQNPHNQNPKTSKADPQQNRNPLTPILTKTHKPLRTHHCKGEERRNLQSEPTKSNINFHRTLPFDLISLAFLCYFLFWEERDIKFEQKYLFTSDFNRGKLQKTHGTYLMWVK